MRIFLLSLFLFMAMPDWGQAQGASLTASYGIFPSNEIARLDWASWEAGLIEKPELNGLLTMGFGVFSVGYAADVGRSGRWRLGATAIYSQTKANFAYPGLLYDCRQSVHTYFYSALINASHVWLSSGNLRLYSGAALGGSYQYARKYSTHESKRRIAAAYHVNAFGIRLGTPVGTFLEVGYGFAGVANFGVVVDL